MSETAERVKKIVVEHLGVEAEKVTEDASFIDDLGADSLDIVELVMAFEEEFGVEIPDDAAEKITTVKDAIKDDASEGGDKVVDGDLFRATYIESNRSVVDNKALLAELGATAEQIARHTKVTAVFSVKVTSK